MFVTVVSSSGSIWIDFEYGNIVQIEGDWPDDKVPTWFNVSEYKRHYSDKALPDIIDINDIGYKFGTNSYQSPQSFYRNAKALQARKELGK